MSGVSVAATRQVRGATRNEIWPGAVHRALLSEQAVAAAHANPLLDAALGHAACDETPLALLALADNGNLSRTNRQFSALFGLDEQSADRDLLERLAAQFADPLRFARLCHAAEAYPRNRLHAELPLASGVKVALRSVPLTAPDDALLGRLWLFEALTDRHGAHELDEATFRSIVEQELAAVCIVDSSETLIYVNAVYARFFGRRQADIAGRALAEFVPPEQWPCVRSAVHELLSGEQSLVRLTYPVANAIGDTVEVRVHAAAGRFRGQPAVLAMVLDVTEHRQAEQKLARTNRTLRTLSCGHEALVRATSEQQLLQDMCRILVEVGDYPMCWIGFAAEASDASLRVAAVHRRAADASVHGPAPAMTQPDGPAAAALARGTPVIRAVSLCCDGECGCDACAAFPFLQGSAACGVLVLAARTQDGFDADEVALLSDLARDLGYGIQALRAHVARDANARRLREIMNAMVQALITTLEQRDPYTAGHQRRVAALSGAMARLMGVPADEIEGIVLAAMVHDVGKVRVPADILARPGKLSALEFELVKTHAEAGYDILKGIDFPWPVATMVRQHHERLDGSGYPDRLCASDILLGSRILAVADVVESMMTHRPYRAALGQAVALAEIADGKGRLYDPAAVDACIALFQQHGFTFPEIEAE